MFNPAYSGPKARRASRKFSLREQKSVISPGISGA